ncbi:cupin domain-containing protein [Saccharobesus litoralis]|nr:cupin domain-containing protein [Saccharobesus litoralis]
MPLFAFKTLLITLCIACLGGCQTTLADKNSSSQSQNVSAQGEVADLSAVAHFSNVKPAQQTQGIGGVKVLGQLPLAQELDSIDDKALRVRELIMLPGATVAVHTHQYRPGVAYILQGEVVEYRSDSSIPLTRSVGQIVFEKHDLTHWWHNQSQQTVKALVVDIIAAPTPAAGKASGNSK